MLKKAKKVTVKDVSSSPLLSTFLPLSFHLLICKEAAICYIWNKDNNKIKTHESACVGGGDKTWVVSIVAAALSLSVCCRNGFSLSVPVLPLDNEGAGGKSAPMYRWQHCNVSGVYCCNGSFLEPPSLSGVTTAPFVVAASFLEEGHAPPETRRPRHAAHTQHSGSMGAGDTHRFAGVALALQEPPLSYVNVLTRLASAGCPTF